MKIPRYLAEKIHRDLNKKKVIIVYGARQVGKTTLAKTLLKETDAGVYYNCDLDEVRELFEKHSLEHLRTLVQKYDIVLIDEAQRVKNIGLTLKILIDNFPEKNFLVTGSSSFALASTVSEPLTGRFFSHTLFPVAMTELSALQNPIETRELLDERLIFGSYPEAITTIDRLDKQRIIENISDNYLFKDILTFGVIKDTSVFRKLLQAVALQVGNEVSHSELAKILEIDKNTVKKYLDLCENMFILFSLPPYYSNKRKAISKMKKYYFCDVGIRNSLLRNFNALDIRNDVGALWENFLVAERMKYNASRDFFPQYYFWRSYQGQEIDLLEESGGEVTGFELKYTKSQPGATIRKIFTDDLRGKSFSVINKENFGAFVGM